MTQPEIDLQPGTAEWEALCQRCGRCCYEKYEYRGTIYYSIVPCPHLNTTTRLCRIYRRRFKLHPDCTQITPEVIKAGILPEDCPYTRLFAKKDPMKK